MLKATFRALTPPVIWDVAHLVKVAIRPPPETDVRCQTWEAVKSAAAGYEDCDLTAFRLARFKANLEAGTLPAVESRPLYWLTKMFGENLHVTDFGGSFGEYGRSFLARFPKASYTVVETPAVVNVAPLGPVQFVSDIPAQCDIFLTSGALQYLDDPYQVLHKGFAGASKAVVLARNCFSHEPVFRVQKSNLFDNGDGNIPEGFEDRQVTYPVRSIDENEVIALAKSTGYSLLLRAPEPPPLLDHSIYGAQFVYLRR